MSITHEVAASAARARTARAARYLYFFANKYDCGLITLQELAARANEFPHVTQQGIAGCDGTAYMNSVYRAARQLADIAGIELY